MQHINLNKTLELENKIDDLLLISIDDQIETCDDEDGIKVIGNIAISGKVRTIEKEIPFSDNINLDVFLTNEEVEDRSLLNISVSDFTYNIVANKLILNISLKIEGLKEIETTFLAEEDKEDFQENKMNDEEKIEDTEIEEEKKVYIDADVNIGDTKEERKEEDIENKLETLEVEEKDINIIQEKIDRKEEIVFEEKEEVKAKKSLLKSVFSSRKINEEISWKLHCVKNETSYEEIANKYNVNLNELISINHNESITEGKLIFIPLK